MKKFTENDIIVNTIKVYPKVRFFVHSGSVSYNDTKNTGVFLNDFLYQESIVNIETIPAGSLLLEDGDTLMTEDGDYIIIE